MTGLADRIWWDCATGWPLSSLAQQAVVAGYADGWGLVGAKHREGRNASLIATQATQTVASFFECAPQNVSFHTSFQSGVLAALDGVLRAKPAAEGTLGHYAYSSIDPSVVAEHARAHEAAGGTTTVLPVSATGRLSSADDLDAALTATDSAAVFAQWVNPELGTIQDLAAWHAVTSKHQVPLIVDVSYGLGYLPPPQHADVVLAHAAAWGGPSGTTVMVRKPGVRYSPGLAETLSAHPTPEVLATAVSLADTPNHYGAPASAAHAAVRTLRTMLPELIDHTDVAGDPDHRAPHIVTASFMYCPAEQLVERLDAAGFAVGSGSACTSRALEPSHVLAATGNLTHGNVRIGIPAGSDESVLSAQVDKFLAVIPEVVADIRAVTMP